MKQQSITDQRTRMLKTNNSSPYGLQHLAICIITLHLIKNYSKQNQFRFEA